MILELDIDMIEKSKAIPKFGNADKFDENENTDLADGDEEFRAGEELMNFGMTPR